MSTNKKPLHREGSRFLVKWANPATNRHFTPFPIKPGFGGVFFASRGIEPLFRFVC